MDVPSVPARRTWGQTFGSLRHRDFRLLCVEIGLTNASRWMEFLVVGLVVLKLTNSPFWVGAIAAVRSWGWLLGPAGGLLADRFDRRRLLAFVQATNVVQATALLTMLVLDRANLGALFFLALVNSLVYAMEYPTRHALMADLVGRDSVANAVAVSRMAMDVTSVVGPFLAGAFMQLFTPAGGYALVLAFYVVCLVAVVLVRPRPPLVRGGSAWSELRAGLGYVRVNQAAGSVLALALLANLLGFPFMFGLLPVFGRDVLEAGPAQLGILMASAGLGGMLGSLLLARMGDRGRSFRLMMVGFLAWAGLLFLFAVSRWYGLSLALLLAAWTGQSVAMSTGTSLLLTLSEPAMVGRVMGARALAVVGLPLGSLALGAATARLGASPALAIFSAALLGSVLVAGLVRPRLWRAT
ncbi:MAG: MFS transporter [Chloroflexi bacterium]|nr:MFS transporter [Chloroflexota bacterium]